MELSDKAFASETLTAVKQESENFRGKKGLFKNKSLTLWGRRSVSIYQIGEMEMRMVGDACSHTSHSLRNRPGWAIADGICSSGFWLCAFLWGNTNRSDFNRLKGDVLGG